MPKRRPYRPRIKGIIRDARILNRNPRHLSSVLNGDRESPPLIRRYNRLQSLKATGRYTDEQLAELCE